MLVCENALCEENKPIGFVHCHLYYDTYAVYCDKCAKKLSYCSSCGYSLELNKDGKCKSCANMIEEAKQGGWRD